MKFGVVGFILLFLLSVSPAEKPEIDTLLDGSRISHGGYGAPVLKFTSIGDEFALFIGAQGGWVLNNRIVLGLAFYTLANNITKKDLTGNKTEDATLYTNFFYGGAFFKYIFFPKKLFHFSTGFIVAAGAIEFNERKENSEYSAARDKFLVVEPEVNLYINVIEFFKIGIGVTYRVIFSSDTSGATNSDLGGFSGQFMMEFGKF